MSDQSTSLIPPDPRLPGIDQLREIVVQLRGPGGCPWDREQTHASLRPGLIEESYEVVAAINAGDDVNLREELGDLLLQTVFHAQLAEEQKRFTFDDVARGIAEKLVRRHPHVFGGAACADSAQVLDRWEDLKRAEKGGETHSALDGVSEGLPALLRAEKIQKKAARVGFDWPDLPPVLEKIREELGELEAAVAASTSALGSDPDIEDELGDLLFATVNLARKLKVDGEVALQRAADKFARRFRAVETLAARENQDLSKLTLGELDALWEAVKRKATTC